MCGLSGEEWAFWAGAEQGGNAPFHVGHDGSLHASNASIKGSISASSISGSSITGSAIQGNDISGGTISGTSISGSTLVAGYVDAAYPYYRVNINSNGVNFRNGSGYLVLSNGIAEHP